MASLSSHSSQRKQATAPQPSSGWPEVAVIAPVDDEKAWMRAEIARLTRQLKQASANANLIEREEDDADYMHVRKPSHTDEDDIFDFHDLLEGAFINTPKDPGTRRAPRAVSPERSSSVLTRRRSNTVVKEEEEDQYVYVAQSMRGECFHSHRHCTGLRNAHGTTPILRSGAEMRGMRPCRYCRPTPSEPPKLLCQQKEDSLIVQTKDSQQQQQQVFVAASLKGQCYHCEHSCYGLRSARGVKSVPLDTARDMSMRPCQLCRPINNRKSEVLAIQSSREDALGRMAPRCATLPTTTTTSSSLTASCYWTAPTGKCYHQSKNCSSLRRSKSVRSQSGKPAGKRPCSLCC